MKVLIVANYRESVGGISGQVKLLHEHLLKEGISTEIFSTKASVLNRLRMFPLLRKKSMAFDVIHVHCCSYVGFFPAILAIRVAKSLRKKIVLTYHGGGAERFFGRYAVFVRHYLRQTDTNIVLSGFLEKIFTDNNIPCVIIPNILNESDSFSPCKRERIYPHYISVRTLEPLYNVQCILRAYRIVKDKLPDARLEILGDGSCRAELEKYVSDNRIANVHFLGRVPNASINKYLSENDIFLSMPIVDNQPMSVLEAWRNGLLVISSDVGGVPYMVEDQNTGILVESDSHEELAKNMIEAVKQQEKTLGIIANGQEALKKYSWSNIRLKLLDVYSR